MSLDEIRILIVAESPLARAGLAALVEGQPGLTVVGQAAPDADLADTLTAYRPHVAAWDLGWDAARGLDALAEVRDAGVPLLALIADPASAGEALAAGARGVLLQDASPPALAAGLTAVAQGLVVIAPALLPTTLATAPADAPLPADALTPRELEVLTLMAEGLANKTIAARLGISEHTVKFHVNALMSKLGAQSRTEAVVRATRQGLIVL